ncbi:MAG: NADH-quinone oxidoreductase subunit NuoH [Chloroflexi bacterium]|nr:NADH-quinone oxidoreductase subunit NuoH [Chloroflexota bacterium]
MNWKRTLTLIVGLVFGLVLLLGVLSAPVDTLVKIIVLAAVAVIVGATSLLQRPLLTVAILAVLTLLALLILNISAIVTGVGNVLTFAFSPESRVDWSRVIVCSEDSTCSTIWSFLFGFIVLFGFITAFAYTTLLERRFIAWFQHRVGPNRVGPAGLLQPLADAIKLIFKEDIVPKNAFYTVWLLAPLIKVVPVLLVLAVIPLGPDLLIPWFDGNWYQVPLVLADINVGVLWLLAITSIGTYGIVLAGWSSNNKYAMLGGLRSTAQMISYELSLGLTMAVPVLIVGSMNLTDIINAQATPPIISWFVFQNPLAAAVLMIALLAEVNRAPFDLPEAEQELTAGYMTEYSGMKFASFMMAEYLGMIVISLIVASLYFGGYHLLLVNEVPILGPLFLLLKVVPLLIGMVWVRATLPRIRYDQLMNFGWKVMLPLALLAVTWSAVAVVIGDTFQNTTVYMIVSGVLFVVTLAGGLYLLNRAGRPMAEVGAESLEEDLADDPIVTGERRDLGWALLNVLGGIIGGLFALVSWITGIFRGIARAGGIEDEDDRALVVRPEPGKPATRAKTTGGD